MVFGTYAYGFWLGPEMLGHVPYFIPPSWFAMSIISLDLAGRLTTTRTEHATLADVWHTVLNAAPEHTWTLLEGSHGAPF